MMNNLTPDNYIIGGGVAGLIAAWYTDYKIIDTNLLGQLSLRFIPGIRVIKDDAYARQFCEDVIGVGMKDLIEKQIIRVGYEDADGEECELNDKFKMYYSRHTRNRDDYEPTFLSSGEKEFHALTLAGQGDANDFYNYIFNRLALIMFDNGRVINSKVKAIELSKHHLSLTNTEKRKYDKLITTIRMDHFLNACNLSPIALGIDKPLQILSKCFYQTLYTEEADIEKSKKYNYVYSIRNLYTRKTYFNKYIVYETNKPLPFGTNFIDGNVILDRYENVPIQIQESHEPLIEEYEKIKMVGRFAQWHHSIKSNQIIRRMQNAHL